MTVRRFDVALDIGGAFVDLCATSAGAAPRTGKTPRRDALVAELVEEALAAARIGAAEVGRLRLSTTLAANALIGGTAAPVALVATAGFTDLPELGRQSRRDPDAWPPPPPTPPWLCPEPWRVALPGRIGPDGAEVRPLDPAPLEALRALPAGAPVAVCLLFAHRNPVQERAAAARIAALRPDLPLSLSHLVDPAPREFERMLATLADAALKPLARRLGVPGLPEPWAMGAEGALAPLEEVAARPLGLVASGPAAGALAVARLAPEGVAIGLDIGSVTADVSLHRDGAPLRVREVVLPAFALRLRAPDATSLPLPMGIAWLAEEVRRLAFRRNIDPAAATLVVGGGAGPELAPALAEALRPRALLVPPDATVMAATGLAAAPAGATEEIACDLPLAELGALRGAASAAAARLAAKLRGWGVAAPRVVHLLDLAAGPRAEPVEVPWTGEAEEEVAARHAAACITARGHAPPGVPRLLALRSVATGALPPP